MEILYIALGFILGALLIWFIQQSRLGNDKSRIQERSKNLEEQLVLVREQLQKERSTNINQATQLSTSKNEIQNLQKQLSTQKQEMEQLQEKFKVEFENIANRLLEENSKKFTTQNEEKIDKILKPLGEKIKQFEKKVEDTHKESIEKSAALRQQIIGLKELNQLMSKEANNLTKALKGDSKIQGNWGEVILERILEKSGLQKNREYRIQESLTNEDGRRMQPDVVVYLPDNRQIVIDSKVSLVAFERYTTEDDDELQNAHIKEHIKSVRNHIKDLGKKKYQTLYSLNSLDFVLMFIPIEPAFNLATTHDDKLYTDAFDNNIVLVSQSTLLATLRTITSIWKQEYQNRNVRKIADEAGSMYDKFVNFVDDLRKVGNQMNTAKLTYEKAMNKLVDGKGNLVSKAEKIKELGAKSNKRLNADLLERSTGNKSETAKESPEKLFEED